MARDLSPEEKEIQELISDTIKENKIVIFMKGSPMQPMCGFSANSSSILSSLDEPYSYVDVIEIPQARAGVKIFTDWPTIPQIFVNGEFIGGNDILQQMAESGELKALVAGEAPAPVEA